MIKPRIEMLPSKRLVGMRLKMSLSENKTAELWKTFMPRRSETKKRIGSHYISMQVFDQDQDDCFSLDASFDKWATVEVADQEQMPDGMEAYTLAGGLYAVFNHRGPASAAPEVFQKIFGVWLPDSGYALDAREHFEVLPENYRPDDPEATEEIWIPIRNWAKVI